MYNHVKSAHGPCVKKGEHFMLVKINSVPSKLEELHHFASFPNIVCIFTLKKFLQFRFRKCLLLKLRSRVKSVFSDRNKQGYRAVCFTPNNVSPIV